MKVFLHVGMHKTATTFLQAVIFSKIKNVNFIHNFELGSKVYEDKLNIISNEGFSGNTYHPFKSAEERYIKADRLKAMFPDAYVLVGTRMHLTWMPSLYSQYLKRGGALTYEKWKENVDPDYFDYDRYITYLKKLFGEKKVHVYKFEDLKENHHKFVLGICAFLEVDVPEYKNKVYQKGFTPGQKESMRKINKIFKSSQNPSGKLPFEAFRYVLDMVRKTDKPKELRNV